MLIPRRKKEASWRASLLIPGTKKEVEGSLLIPGTKKEDFLEGQFEDKQGGLPGGPPEGQFAYPGDKAG